MNVHLHHARNLTGWILGIAAFSPFALCFETASSQIDLSAVTGRITYSGRPINDMTICLDSAHGEHSAFSMVRSDGSFRLLNMRFGGEGALPGRYHAHLYSTKEGVHLPAKYADPRTSGVEIEISPDWSDVDINLN